jgi:hypothetical protein
MTFLDDYITQDDFVIIIRPVKQGALEEEEEEEWAGEVQVSIVANVEETSLSEEEFSNMVVLCNFAAAAIPATEENELIRDLIQSYVEKHMLLPVSGEIEKIGALTLDSETEGNA